MKKIFALLLAMMMLLSLAACGGGDEQPSGSEEALPADSQQQEQQTPEPTEPEPTAPEAAPSPAETAEPADLSGYLGTKTGRFYSRFADGRMYMEYEVEMEGQTMTVISATDGDRNYSETRMDGMSLSASIMDGEDMYTIDHANKMVIKMSVGASAQTIAGAVLEESDVDMGDLKTGTREIDGKTYDTEEWIIEGASSIMCFDGDALVYMIGAFEGEEMVMKIIEVSDKVDDSLFEIPGDYSVMAF